ncbi:SLS1 [Candida metapsilosis]|uniref:SLS1 n=1 Tax=Candida metapsilosis TaxID=273372 RepID=A0A8H7ZC25_9ASCO|nr:SLS1 [Candida metapsilosis]
MLIRHCLQRKPSFAPRRAFSLTTILYNVVDSQTSQPISTTEEVPSGNNQKRIFLKPDQIKKRKRRQSSGKWTSSTSSRQPRSAASPVIAPSKVDLALIQELYRKNKNDLNSSTTDEEDGDLSRYIETFKPFESKIGSKRYDKLTKEIYNAFKKNQIVNYINHYRTKNPGLPPLKSRLNKSQLIESLFTTYWKITKEKSGISNEELLSSRVIELTPVQRFLLDPQRSKFIRNLIASNIKVQLSKNKLSVSGLKSELDNIEAEIVQLNNRIKWEDIDLSLIKKERLNALDFGELSIASSSYFQDLGHGKYKISANSQANIDLAKRLILWAFDYNPHIQTLFYNQEDIEEAQLIPYINEDVWPWSEKHAKYYSLFYKDRKPGTTSDLVFEKFDKMNDKFLKSKSLKDLVDQRLALKSEKNTFIDETLSDEILSMFKSVGGKEESEGDQKVDHVSGNGADVTDAFTEKLQKEFDLDKIIKNRQESASTTSDHQQHLNLEALRHELGAFEDDLKLEDFPEVSNLIVDAEKQTSDEVLEILRTELGAYAEDDGSASIEDSAEVSEADDVSEGHSSIAPSSLSATNPLKKHLLLSDEQIDNLYTQLNDLTFTKDLPGSSRKTEPYSAYTIQFGSLLFKQDKNHSKTDPDSSSRLSQAKPNQFKFLTSIPFIKDLATSLPILYNGNQTFTNKMQIRLTPSIYQNSDNNLDDAQVLQNYYPPVEIQADLNDWGRIKLETLQVLSIEAMNNMYIAAAPKLATDLQVSKLVVGDLLQPQMDEQQHNGVSFDNQPNLATFLEESQLNFGGKVQIKPSSSIELCLDGKFIKYDFVHLTYKTDLMFDLNGRELCLSIIEGGTFGGKRFEVILGDGELSRDEFSKFVNDAIEFSSEI